MTIMFINIQGHTLYADALKADSIIIDLGANLGRFSQEMKSRFGGRYYLVEANPVLVEKIRQQGEFPVWGNVIASKPGMVSFNIAKNDTGSSVLTLPQQSIWNSVLEKTIEVPAITLEQLMSLTETTHIDLLKMDIEGTEVEILQSLSKPLLDGIGQLTVEFHSHPMFGFNLVEEVEKTISYMWKNGFWCMDFSEGSRCDVLFVNRKTFAMPWYMQAMWKLRTTRPAWISKMWLKVPAPWRSRLYSFLERN